MDTNINSIISKFISKGVELIYTRYNRIADDEISIVRKIIYKVKENNLAFGGRTIHY